MENVKREELEKLVGTDKVNIFYKIVDEITLLYNMDQAWNNGGKKWTYEYKFRKSGKTLCAFYFKENMLGFMIIFGKEERTKVEEIRNELLEQVQRNFRWMPELVTLLRKYEKKQFKYGNFENFYPNVIDFFTEYNKMENKRFDVLK